MELSPDELIIEHYPPLSNKGGMLICTIPKGVKITHKPTGIVVISDNERHQYKNKCIALSELEYKLVQVDVY